MYNIFAQTQFVCTHQPRPSSMTLDGIVVALRAGTDAVAASAQMQRVSSLDLGYEQPCELKAAGVPESTQRPTPQSLDDMMTVLAEVWTVVHGDVAALHVKLVARCLGGSSISRVWQSSKVSHVNMISRVSVVTLSHFASPQTHTHARSKRSHAARPPLRSRYCDSVSSSAPLDICLFVRYGKHFKRSGSKPLHPVSPATRRWPVSRSWPTSAPTWSPKPKTR